MPAPVERRCRFLRILVGRCRAGCEEAGADPFHQVVRRDVVGGYDDDALAAALADPVLGHRNRLRRACAGAIDLCIGAACTDLFSELRVAHRQDAEQEAAIEVVFGLADESLELRDAPFDFVDRAPGAIALVRQPLVQALEAFQLLAMPSLGVVIIKLLAERIHSGEGRREDHAGFVTERVRQAPAIRQLAAGGRGLVVHYERDPGVTQRVQADRDGQCRRGIECPCAVGIDAEFFGDIEVAGPTAEFDDVFRVVDRDEDRVAFLRFDEPRDVFLGHRLPQAERKDVNKLFAMQDATDVLVIEDLLRARQSEGCAANDDILGASGARVGDIAAEYLLAARNEFIEQTRQFFPGVRFRRRGGRRRRCGNGFLCHRLCDLPAYAMAGRVQAAKCLVE